MMKYCLTLLMFFSVPALAIDVRALKDQPKSVVEQLPASVSNPHHVPNKTSLMEHLRQSAPNPPTMPSGPPTSLPPSGNLPPLPPSMTAPTSGWSELPPLPDDSPTTPSKRSHSARSSGSKATHAPKQPVSSSNGKEKLAQCVAEVQQQAQGKPTKLLRNDNQVYSIVVIDNDQRSIITCYANKDKTVE